jgi:hypothetical protein
VKRIDNYSTISAREMRTEGLRATTLTILSHSAWRFFSDYFLKYGFLDGYYGFIISILNAYLTLLKYAKLKELELNKTAPPE